jgi:hypothetical protein
MGKRVAISVSVYMLVLSFESLDSMRFLLLLLRLVKGDVDLSHYTVWSPHIAAQKQATLKVFVVKHATHMDSRLTTSTEV